MSEAKDVIFEAMGALCDVDAVMRPEMMNYPLPETLVTEVEGILVLYSHDDEEIWDLVCDAVYRYDKELSKYFY